MDDRAFVWLLHQPAAAGWLKRELAARRPDLRFAFARPGLTTYKVELARADEAIASSFARAWGRSLGRASSAAEVVTLAAALPGPLRLHAFERDPDRPADERDPGVAGTRAVALAAELRAAAPGRFVDGDEARDGELVLDVVTAPAEAADDGLLVGWHRADRARGRWPGGVPHAAIPAEAPSRAWAKIEEAIRWSAIEPRAGDVAIELGAAPGGASFALLERGLTVHGIDPGAVAPRVLAYVGPRGNRFVHHAVPAAEVDRRAVPRPYQWLLSDMNLAPMVALKYVERFVALADGGLRGAFITLKLNDDGIFQALPGLLARIGKLGAREVRCVQLPSHRNEVVAILRY